MVRRDAKRECLEQTQVRRVRLPCLPSSTHLASPIILLMHKLNRIQIALSNKLNRTSVIATSTSLEERAETSMEEQSRVVASTSHAHDHVTRIFMSNSM